tara:strand:+ start:419 stop:838 length:420 start_codon:yes stop_codon:yes gene_type:complete
MYENIAYPLSSFPSQGKWEHIPETYIDYQKLLDERIKKQEEERQRESESHNYSKFKNFFDQYFDNYGERENPLDCEYEEYDDEYPHSVFGLKKSASQEDMKTAYRKAVRATHPDKTGEDSEDEFREVQEAWEYYTNYIN